MDEPRPRTGDLQARWRNTRVNPDAIFIKDGKYHTSSGITAGIDLSIGFVEENVGNKIALKVARELIVYLKRSGGQLQYSQPLLLQTRMKTKLGDIASLAERANLSPRHFDHKFKATFGLTPADFVEELRLDEARWLLVNGDSTIDAVAADIGYRRDDAFRRAFERRALAS